MKKLFSSLLVCLMILSTCNAALAEANFEEPIAITANYYMTEMASADDDVYRHFADKFNIEIDMNGISSDAWVSTNNIMISGGNMYDWMSWEFDYATYISYVDQGLLKPLPEGWEERYPTLYKAMEASGIMEQLYVDGQIYAIPHTIYLNYTTGDVAFPHQQTILYRADWLEELGMGPWGETVTVSEMMDFCRAAVEADMAQNGQTIGLCGSEDALTGLIMNLFNTQYDKPMLGEDGQYIWGPTAPGVTDGIVYYKSLYESGAIDPDFYLTSRYDAQNDFSAGLAAVICTNGTITNIVDMYKAVDTATVGDPYEIMKCTVLVDDEGVWHGNETTNFWLVSLFNAEMDDAALERTLYLIDYLYTPEAELIVNMGIEGVDWQENEDGSFESLLDPQYEAARYKYPSCWFWRFSALCPDEFSFINPTEDQVVQERVNALYATRAALAEEYGYTPLDAKVTYLTGEAMDNYSVNVMEEVVRIVVDANITADQVETEWTNFIEDYRNMWQPVIDALNAE